MKTAILLSGGVDSSVALFELMSRGKTNITAFYLKIWLEDEVSFLGNCPWEEDLSFARAVCDKASVPLKVIALQEEYYQKVIEYTLRELRLGHTPSPDILCNQHIKFSAFFDKIDQDFDLVASGHYAVVQEIDGIKRLFRSPDPIKDQSYFLSHLSQLQISRVNFPIGKYYKSKVRELAQLYQLPNKIRKDSQGVCFLGKIKYNDFIKHYLGEKRGWIVEQETGKKLGQHQGFWFYTIGQRQGLGLSNGPWYVVAKDIAHNTIFVSHKEQQKNQERTRFIAGELTWIHRSVKHGEALTCKLRHGPGLLSCKVSLLPDNRLEVTLGKPDCGIAPGQFVVLYDGQECLGGGMILSVPA